MIRDFQPQDLSQIVSIFNHYVENEACTFQLIPFTDEDMVKKIDLIQKHYPFLVIEENQEVLGFAYGSRWREKQAYDLSVETTIYLQPYLKGKGIGSRLYKSLIDNLKSRGYHLLVACLTLPNPASVKLHQRLGFQEVGEFTHAGRKFDRWHNVSYWQKLLTE